MKHVICILFMLLSIPFHFLSGQKVDIEGDDVIVDGSSWAKIYRKGVLDPNFTLATPSGMKFMQVKYNDGVCIGTWLGKGQSFKMEQQSCVAKFLVKELYGLDVLQDGEVNETALQDFISSGELMTSEQEKVTTPSQGDAGYEIVERDRTKMIQIFGETIRQDFKDIGTITKKSSYASGKNSVQYSVFSNDGTLIATATYAGPTELRADIVTAKDNRRHSITAGTTLNRDKDFAAYLVKMLYL